MSKQLTALERELLEALKFARFALSAHSESYASINSAIARVEQHEDDVCPNCPTPWDCKVNGCRQPEAIAKATGEA